MKTWLLIFALATAATAAAEPLTAYDEGALAFTYVRFPVGSYEGHFSADGPAGGAAELLEPGETQGCGGVLGGLDGEHVLVAYGAVRNPDTSVDVAILFVYDDEPVAPGDYAIDPVGMDCLFWYLDDVSHIDVPADLTDADWAAVLDSVEAAHVFASISGSVTVSALDAESVSGTFAGTLLELDDQTFFVSVSGGTFALAGGIVPAEASSLGALKASFR